MLRALRHKAKSLGASVGVAAAVLMSLTVWAHACAASHAVDAAPTAVAASSSEHAGHGAHHHHAHDRAAHHALGHGLDATGSHGTDAPLHCGDGVCDKMQCCVGAVFAPRSSAGEIRTALEQVALAAETIRASRDLPPDEHPPKRL